MEKYLKSQQQRNYGSVNLALETSSQAGDCVIDDTMKTRKQSRPAIPSRNSAAGDCQETSRTFDQKADDTIAKHPDWI